MTVNCSVRAVLVRLLTTEFVALQRCGDTVDIKAHVRASERVSERMNERMNDEVATRVRAGCRSCRVPAGLPGHWRGCGTGAQMRCDWTRSGAELTGRSDNSLPPLQGSFTQDRPSEISISCEKQYRLPRKNSSLLPHLERGGHTPCLYFEVACPFAGRL